VRTFEDDYSDEGEFAGIFCSIYLRYDDNYYQYTRDQYTFMEFLGDVGGLQSSLVMGGYLIVGFFSY
jgi:hypothetical protein